jgi:hypothetical protein
MQGLKSSLFEEKENTEPKIDFRSKLIGNRPLALFANFDAI